MPLDSPQRSGATCDDPFGSFPFRLPEMRSILRHHEPVNLLTVLTAWVMLSLPISLGLGLVLRRRSICHDLESPAISSPVRISQ
jgi:hypothetical protein